MRRREFFGVLGLAAMLPTIARAQSAPRLKRVDYLVAVATEDDPEYEGRIGAFVNALQGLGWVDGHNLKLSIHKVAPTSAEIRKRTAEIVAAEPDVIVTGGGTSTGVVLQATRKIPVVFTTAVDPIGNGYVESLAHPGGNATGFMQFDYSLRAKWLELLKQIAPGVTRVGVIRDATATSRIGQFAVIQSVAGSFNVDVLPIGQASPSDVESGIAKLVRTANAGLIGTLGAGVNSHRDLIVRLAAEHRLPAVYANKAFVNRGGLASYGSDTIAAAAHAASYVDRILVAVSTA